MTTQRGIVTVSWSELDTLRQCPFKHKLAYRERWHKDPPVDSALGKGVLIHELLDCHYRSLAQGLGLEGAVAAVTSLICIKRMLGVDEEILDLVTWIYDGYVEKWGADPDWRILVVENTLVVPLYDYSEGTPKLTRFRLKAKIDLAVRDLSNGLLYVVDHKSGKDLPTEKDLGWEDQFALYELVLNRSGFRVFATIHNAMRTQRNQGDIFKPGDSQWKKSMKPQTLDQRFHRTYMKRTPNELRRIEQDAVDTFKRAYSNKPATERQPNSDTCKWRCSYNEACLMGRRTGDDSRTYQMLLDTGFQKDAARN